MIRFLTAWSLQHIAHAITLQPQPFCIDDFAMILKTTKRNLRTASILFWPRSGPLKHVYMVCCEVYTPAKCTVTCNNNFLCQCCKLFIVLVVVYKRFTYPERLGCFVSKYAVYPCDTFRRHAVTPATVFWISNHMPSKVSDGIVYSFPSFNGCIDGVGNG